MTFITPVYDLLRKTDADTTEAVAQMLSADMGLELKDLEDALKALKATPGNEDKATLTAFVKALMPLAAYSLTVNDQDAQKEAYDHLALVFQTFQELYAKQYSEAAIQKRRDNANINEKDANDGVECLNTLNNICANIKNANKKEAIDAMSNFLLTLTPEKHPLLFDAMVDELHQYRRENTSDFERLTDNSEKRLHKTLENQTLRSDYLQGWERVGYMIGNVFIEVAEIALQTSLRSILSRSGFVIPKIPLAPENDDQGPNNQFMPNPDGKGVRLRPCR